MAHKNIKFTGVLNDGNLSEFSQTVQKVLSITFPNGRVYRVAKSLKNTSMHEENGWSRLVGQTVSGTAEVALGGNTLVVSKMKIGKRKKDLSKLSKKFKNKF